ncbi:hypothetical protein NDU88_003637 [Pleurodeles waltl]|uniref:Myb/SANT-like DNA-binding domain-containing protein n=1 Tax=Pleurodeles waltl TaxID=8319 RepID=A0AAV7SGI9_PLEWA|nr:hypothetical protein NDU88_003637 [Pleurodeles waltl]
MAPERHPRISEEELRVMVEETIRVEPQLFGAQVQQISIARKMEQWRRILDRVNAVGQHPRTRDNIRKWWNNLRVKVSAHQKKGVLRTIAKGMQNLGVYGRRSTHCRKRWEDLRRWAWKTAKAQLGMASQ